MSVKSFLSKLKWNSKIAEGDDNMFIELKTATPLFMVYLQKKKLAFTPERRPGSPIITWSHSSARQRHPSLPRRDISSTIRSAGANRRERWMNDEG